MQLNTMSRTLSIIVHVVITKNKNSSNRQLQDDAEVLVAAPVTTSEH